MNIKLKTLPPEPQVTKYFITLEFDDEDLDTKPAIAVMWYLAKMLERGVYVDNRQGGPAPELTGWDAMVILATNSSEQLTKPVYRTSTISPFPAAVKSVYSCDIGIIIT